MMPVDELSALLSGPSRVIVIASQDVNLQAPRGKTDLILLKLVEGALAAGGRGGGFGERRVVMVSHFRYDEVSCEKLSQIVDEAKAGEFEVPYFVARMPLVLRDGEETVGYGVVDGALVGEMISKLAKLSSA